MELLLTIVVWIFIGFPLFVLGLAMLKISVAVLIDLLTNW